MLWDVVSELHQLAENELRQFVVPLGEWINPLARFPSGSDRLPIVGTARIPQGFVWV